MPRTTLFAGLILFIFSYFLIGDNLQAKWGIIDDHEIAMYLAGQDKLKIEDYISTLKSTEVFSFGKSNRYRPVYYFLRVTETLIWGNNYYLWYLIRFLSFTFSIFIFWYIARQFIGWAIGFLVMLVTLTLPFWGDIVARLGPSEIYALPGLAIFLLGFINLLKGKDRSFLWVLITVGTILMAGSKETFIFLIPIILFLDGYLIFNRKFNLISFLYSILSIGFTALIQISIAMTVLKQGVDYYNNNASLLFRSIGALRYIYHFSLNHVIAVILTLLLGSVFFIYLYKNRYYKEIFWSMSVIGLCSIVVFSQLLVYNNNWPTNMRYDFPGLLVLPTLAILGLYLIKKTASQMLLTTCLLLVLFISNTGYVSLHNKIQNNIARTVKFTNALGSIKAFLDQDQITPILYESCTPWDFEPVESINRFLTKSMSGHTRFLKLNNYSSNSVKPGLEQTLASSLETRSVSGDSVFKPLSSYSPNSYCYSISFSCPQISCPSGIAL